MNYEDMLKRQHTIDIAVAKEVGWICWQMPNGEHRAFPPHARINIEKSGHGHEIQGDWPADVSISGCSPNDIGARGCPAWSRCVDDAMELDGEGWRWVTHETAGFLIVFVWDRRGMFDDPVGDVTVNFADFHTKQEAYATARCMVFLQAMAKPQKDTQHQPSCAIGEKKYYVKEYGYTQTTRLTLAENRD